MEMQSKKKKRQCDSTQVSQFVSSALMFFTIFNVGVFVPFFSNRLDFNPCPCRHVNTTVERVVKKTSIKNTMEVEPSQFFVILLFNISTLVSTKKRE